MSKRTPECGTIRPRDATCASTAVRHGGSLGAPTGLVEALRQLRLTIPREQQEHAVAPHLEDSLAHAVLPANHGGYHAARMSSGRYLLVRLSAIGDVVFGLEALAAIKEHEPDARVDWLVEDRIRGLLDGHPDLDRVIAFPRKALARSVVRPWLWPAFAVRLWSFVRALRQDRYDAVLDLHGNLKSGLQVFAARAVRKIGYAKGRAREGAWRFVRERVVVPRPRPHRAEEALMLVDQLFDRKVSRSERVLLPTNKAAAARAHSILDAIAVKAPGTGCRILLAPGTSSFAAFKRWPARCFAELAESLRRDGHSVIISTGPGEEALAREALGHSGAQWLDGAREGLQVTLEIMRSADLCIAADSGPLHLAQAVGRPVIGLFGPKDPVVYGPRRAGSMVLRYPTPCAPCGRRACAMPLCVRGIPVEMVLAAARRLLDSPQRKALA